ncbi:MAG: hypothetical protein Q8O44_00195, partial [Syntrophales bacterium]|nr:hypothetical protein [Syntrophales bacterium]
IFNSTLRQRARKVKNPFLLEKPQHALKRDAAKSKYRSWWTCAKPIPIASFHFSLSILDALAITKGKHFIPNDAPLVGKNGPFFGCQDETAGNTGDGGRVRVIYEKNHHHSIR